MTRGEGAPPFGVLEDAERALGSIPQLGPGASALHVVRNAVAAATTRLVSQDPVVRLGEDPEGVHKARVATRRLRSDLRTFRPLLDRDWTGSLRAELEWLGGLLGPVRDADVLRARLDDGIARMSGSEPVSGKRLLDDLEIERLHARRRLLEALGSPRYHELIGRLVRAAREPLVSGSDAHRPAASAGVLMARPWRSLARRARQLKSDPSDAALHAVRIRAKRVRYAADSLAPVFGKRAERFASAAEDLQEVLGEHQDSVAALSWLSDHGAGTDDPATAFTAGRLVEMELGARDRARTTWPREWKRLERRKRFWT